ncbi:TetR/AcrR family transcriptional regulator [bacterium]|nr:TetR/AcrR family transcriptional regulator [bacterium]
MSSTLASTTPSQSASTRDRCLDAALSVLQEVGPEALSLREAARRAELSPTAPYRHFADKEAMLAALAERGFGLFEAALRSASPEGLHMMTLDRFQDMGQQYVQFAYDNPDYYRLMFGGVIPSHEAHPALHQAGEQAFGVLLQSIELLQRFGAIKAAPARRLAAHVWALCHGYAALHIEGRVRHIEEASPWQERFRDHFDWLMSGLAPMK